MDTEREVSVSVPILEPDTGERVKKRRVPKACASCRNSKLRCDGGKPCLRCREKNTWCDYVRPAGSGDVVGEKLARLEAELSSLRSAQPQQHPQMQIQTQQHQPQEQTQSPNPNTTALTLLQMQAQTPSYQNSTTPNLASHELYQHFRDSQQGLGIATPAMSSSSSSHQARNFSAPNPNPTFQTEARAPAFSPSKKRKRAEFELNIEAAGDVVSKGLIGYEDAELYFRAFFSGCDRYVPVFDPRYDTFESVRARSSMLFDVICAVGCRAEHGPNTPPTHPLLNTTKTPLCAVILGTAPRTIETIQALLIDACYSEKGWLLTSMALKLALELDLPESYRKLSTLILGADQAQNDEDGGARKREEERLMRETRVWFGVWVLEHILSIDCGKNPGVKAASGESMRRCRVLLRHPARTALDFRLLAQVELNSIRALAHERLSPSPGQDGGFSDDEMSEIVQGTRIDLSVWLSDWVNLVDSHIQNPEERAVLIINLKIQRDWSEMTMLCKGLQGMGIENVAIMTDPQRKLIHLAKNSAKRHLATILADSHAYLATFRYSMDFVWGKSFPLEPG